MQEWMGCCLWVHENKGKTLRSRDFLACDPERTPYHWGSNRLAAGAPALSSAGFGLSFDESLGGA